MLQKNYLFKSRKDVKSGKTLVELHDPDTLDNAQFWLDQGHTINTDNMKLKDKVIATLDVVTFNNRPAFHLKALIKG